MFRAGVIVVAAVLATGCADRRVDDADLGALVIAKKAQPKPIDLDKAATDVAEFHRAMSLPHSAMARVIGPHRVLMSSSVRVESGGEVIEELSDETRIDVDADGNFAATADNNKDYGRHAIYSGGQLFLRPRFGKYHRREPTSADEPSEILDEMFSTTAAYFDLLVARVELSDRGSKSAMRPGRHVDFKTSPAEAERPKEALSHRKWRESIAVEDAAGTAILDSDGGFPLSAKLSGQITFRKGAKQFRMTVTATHAVEPLPAEAAIDEPSESDTVVAPTTRTEVEEQRKLLEGLSRPSDIGDDKGK